MSAAAFDPFAINGPDEVVSVNNISKTQSEPCASFTADFSQFLEEPHQSPQTKNQTLNERSLSNFSGYSSTPLQRNTDDNVDTDIYSNLFTASHHQHKGEMYHSRLHDTTSLPKYTNNSLDQSSLSQSQSLNTSDIYSSLFTTNSPHSNANKSLDKSSQSHSQSLNNSFTPVVYTGDTPVHIDIHESMSCIYDTVAKSTSMTIEGAISIQLSPEITGQSIYLALQDPSNHVGDLTSFFDYATELRERSSPLKLAGVRDIDAFVQRQQKGGHRVFRVDIPGNIDAKTINIIKYTGSELLRPIPLLVNSKVQVASKHCRVRVKIRSNPSNQQPIQQVVILVAVPPNIDGETLKMSTKGGMWDPMKRLIVWSAPVLASGETMEVQMQFEIVTSDADRITPPKFPILVRCDGMKDQLSDITIRIGGGRHQLVDNGGSNSLDLDDSLVLSKAYRLFHRKV